MSTLSNRRRLLREYCAVLAEIFALDAGLHSAPVAKCAALLNEAARLQDEIGEPIASELRQAWGELWEAKHCGS